jgi:hypothetical protein
LDQSDALANLTIKSKKILSIDYYFICIEKGKFGIPSAIFKLPIIINCPHLKNSLQQQQNANDGWMPSFEECIIK